MVALAGIPAEPQYTNLKLLIKEASERFYKLHLSDTSKALSAVIGITHNDTNASYPENTQVMRETGTILIQKFSANGRSPLPKIKLVRGVVREDGSEYLNEDRTLPGWFHPNDIFNHFNGTPIKFS